MGALLAVVVLVAVAAAGSSFVRRQRADRIAALEAHLGDRVVFGIGGFGELGMIFELEASVGRVKRGHVYLWNARPVQGRVADAEAVHWWYRAADGLPLDRIRWIEVDGERLTF